MSDKHHEISTLTDTELAVELGQCHWLIESAQTLPRFGFALNPAIHAAITARHAGLEAEHTPRVAS